MTAEALGFRTVYGRGLVAELPHLAHRPYLVVTMADLSPTYEEQLSSHLGAVHLVETLDVAELERLLPTLPPARSIIGFGGGQAIDVAKFVAWRRRLPLFQVPRR